MATIFGRGAGEFGGLFPLKFVDFVLFIARFAGVGLCCIEGFMGAFGELGLLGPFGGAGRFTGVLAVLLTGLGEMLFGGVFVCTRTGRLGADGRLAESAAAGLLGLVGFCGDVAFGLVGLAAT